MSARYFLAGVGISMHLGGIAHPVLSIIGLCILMAVFYG